MPQPQRPKTSFTIDTKAGAVEVEKTLHTETVQQVPVQREAKRKPNWRAGFEEMKRKRREAIFEEWKAGARDDVSDWSDICILAEREAREAMEGANKKYDRAHGTDTSTTIVGKR